MPKTQIAIRLDTTQLAALDTIAETEGRARTDVIRRLLAEALAARARKRVR